MKSVHVHEIIITGDRGRSNLSLKNEKNGGLKITEKWMKSNESERISIQIRMKTMNSSEWNIKNRGDDVTTPEQMVEWNEWWKWDERKYTGKNDTKWRWQN